MNLKIETLTVADLPTVDELMKRNSSTLGFLTSEALRQFLDDGHVLGAMDHGGSLGAYLLYASYRDYIRVVHLCVDERLRRRGVAERLFCALKRTATTQYEIRLHCRNDYPAQSLWKALGFVAFGEKPGRSARGTTLTAWRYALREPRQLDLFVTKVRDAIDVVIDAQVLFHLDTPVTNNTDPAHQLVSDSLAGTIDLCVTDEHFVEVQRKADEAARARSRKRAHSMRRLTFDRADAQRHKDTLASILPTRTESERSDIAHIANTAASDASIFVTQDDGLLRHAAAIGELTGVTVCHPTRLIIDLHKSANPGAYVQSRTSGLDLAWQRLSPDDLPEVVRQIAVPGEKHGKLREELNRLASHPERYIAQTLRSLERIHALRIMEQRERSLTLELIRVAPNGPRALYADFVVKETIAHAVESGTPLIQLGSDNLAAELKAACLKAGFMTTPDGTFGRFCVAKSAGQSALRNTLADLSPSLSPCVAATPVAELATHCTPVNITGDGSGRYLVPIKPKFAKQLFDVGESGDDFFGFHKQPVMSWENVYYRARTHHKLIRAPGWLLWYVSEERKAIIGVSRLDEVECGRPKEMLRKYRKLGVLEWEDLSALCHGDPAKEIMCLRFSHTFRFTQAVSLAQLRVFEGRNDVPLQSPRKIGTALYAEIFDAGFGRATA